jgi:hypothetical protein
MHCPTQTSKEVTPSSDKEASCNIAAYFTQDGIKCGNKWCKQCPLGTVTMTNNGDDHGWEACGYNMEQVLTTTHGNR